MGDFFKQYLWLIDLVAVLFCSFFAAKITSVYIAKTLEVEQVLSISSPSPSAGADLSAPRTISISDYRVIIERNVFDSSEVPAEVTAEQQASEEAPVPTGEAVKTTLGIKLFGVLVIGIGEDPRSSATVQGVGGNAAIDTYSVGTVDGFAPNTKLIRVKPDRIEFSNSGRLEYALMEDEMGTSIFGGPPKEGPGEVPAEGATPETPTAPLVKETGEGKFVLDQSEVDNALKNLDRLYTEVRAVPNFAGGKVSGIKILSVKQGSIFDKLGLRRGDILERINGMELDVKRGFEIFSTLKDEKKLTLDLVRQGQNQTVEYEIR